MEEAGFTSSSGSVRALSVYAKKELSGEEQQKEKRLRVESSSPGEFRDRAKGSYPEVEVATVELARADGSGGSLAREPP